MEYRALLIYLLSDLSFDKRIFFSFQDGLKIDAENSFLKAMLAASRASTRARA